MARVERTPPNKFASDTNIPASVEDEYVQHRKRKQPDVDDTLIQVLTQSLDEKFNKQLLQWNVTLTETISNSVSTAVNTALSSALSKISSSLAEINSHISKLNTDNASINASLFETNSRMDDIVKTTNVTVERQDLFDSHVRELENKISAMEQQARQCNLEISNMPERRGENLINILLCLGTAIKSPIETSDIAAIHRVPHADAKNTRPKNVIVKLNSRMQRDNIITAYRATKGLDSSKLSITGNPTTIYLNEHLTLANKLLYRQCREVAKEHGYKYVWIKHGTILVRKSDTSPVMAVRSKQDLVFISLSSQVISLKGALESARVPERAGSGCELATKEGNESALSLLRPPHLKWLTLTGFLMFGLFSLLNGLFLMAPDIINKVMSYSETEGTVCTLINQLESNVTSSDVCSDSISRDTFSIMAVATLVSGILVTLGSISPLSKKTLLITMYATVGVACLVSRLSPFRLLTGVAMSALQLTALGIGPLTAYAVDLFPTTLRGTAVGAVLMFGRVGSAAGANAAGYFLAESCTATFYGFAVLTFVCGALSFLLPSDKQPSLSRETLDTETG